MKHKTGPIYLSLDFERISMNKYRNTISKIVILFLGLFLIISAVNTASASSVYLKKVDNKNFQIYQKPTNSTHWEEYYLKRFNTPAKKGYGPQDVYRIDKLYYTDLTKKSPDISGVNTKNKVALTNGGNWEKAVYMKTSKGSTWIGGGHGYEKMVSLKVYKEGKHITPTIGKVTTSKNLKIVVVSNFIHPGNLKTVLAKVTTTYHWNGETLKNTNKYEWKREITIHTAYASMFPVSNNPNVSSRGQLYGQKSQTLYIGYTPNKAKSKGGVLSNKVNNLKLSMRIVNPEKALFNYLYCGSTKTYIKVNNLYNKLYVSLVSPNAKYKVQNGTIWDITTEYKVWNHK